nr:transcription activator GLK1-like [Coffea arabica]
MLAVSPLRTTKDERQDEMESFENGGDDFPDFSCGNLLDSIDFDDLFVGINDEDVLPDLEMDPEMLAEFSLSGGEESEITTTSTSNEKMEENSAKEEVDKANYSGPDASSGSTLTQTDDMVMSKRDESVAANPSAKEADKARKSSTQSKANPQGKRKVKVDWTPELHRRFVQAVEQLGVDKAVPSRILEIMGIDCLTRHNIASHLQKYRSHRKHLLAREAEAANWSQRRQMYGAAAAPAAAGGKREMNHWIAPTMGFPPMAPMPHFRPLHVWGHPSVDQSLMPVWPKHLGPSPPPPPVTWAPAAPAHPPTPPPDPSFWHSHHARVPNSLTPGTPCFPPHLAPTRFPTPPVPGIPPPALYKVDPGIAVPTAPAGQPVPQPPIDFHPSKESIDAAIGDVLSKPWQPLPLGLKPPSVDSVLVELHRQGISRIPPTACV